MNPQRNSMGVFLFLGIVVFFGTRSHCQTCEVDFHMESMSVMLLPGDNASVLCDATCFGHDSGVDVTWRNAFGKQVGSSSSRVFSVRYNRGLMNRILLINASHDTVGTYICTVTRNAEVLHHKPMEFIILGSNGNVINVPREDTGPRRGDITADRDLDYRPVRSVDRARSRMDKRHLNVDHLVRQRDHQYRELQENKWIEKRGEESKVADKNSYGTTMFQKMNTINERNQQLQNVFNKVQTIRNLGLDTKHTNLVQSRSVSEEKRINDVFGIMDLKLQTRDGFISDQQIKAENSGPSNTKIFNEDQSYTGYLRVRRQIESQTTTEDPDITSGETDTATKEAVQDNTASGQPQAHTDNTTSNDSYQSTSESEQTSSDSTILPTLTPEKATGKTEENPDDGLNDDVTSAPCTVSPSSFGKYGVLAFSITLAVAFLLLYAILMIIFMPKIMARRKGKSDIEVGAYRRTGPDTSDTAPLAVLNGSDFAECDVIKHDTAGFDNPAFQSEETADIKKEEATTETTASVSTFLLRQDSGRQTEQASQEKETEDETKANDKEDSSPQTDKTQTAEPTEQPPASALNEIRPESSRPQESSDLLNDFRFSDFMMSTNVGQSEGASLADEKADSGMDGICGNGSAGSCDTGVDLLPPSPSDQNNV